ncbi:MOSC domain-containing protein [Aquabacter sp. CN5-332]|uniref:MOSC domain-containing protein n=1 Tax=Aquabacter sp. CN5-332 TaxID=3156608 RepID=UPI0032B62066
MTPIDILYCGTLAPLGPRAVASGIAKRPMPGPWTITRTGIVGDAQGDTQHHGGLEKAIHHYPHDHYAAWRLENPDVPAFHRAPAFGENISTAGLTEDDVCVGDIYRLGGVRLQISQGRQPCWRLGAHSGWPELPKRVRATARTGWYYRVIEAGEVVPGSPCRLDHRPRPEWTVGRLMRAMLAREIDRDELGLIAEIPELSEGWRQTCRKRLAAGKVEDWGARLDGPA